MAASLTIQVLELFKQRFRKLLEVRGAGRVGFYRLFQTGVWFWFGFVVVLCVCWGGGGLVWFGLVWFGLVWFGLVWFGLVWFALGFRWHPRFVSVLQALPLCGAAPTFLCRRKEK
ncbi:hypothetical protein [Paraburkholderia largidicola]|uniref:hypothetical protein n=1 Tax=Paraburkholderia largidicola TaxID=3014751 RepID=UPI0015D9C3B1|nr:hypothetical protein [Paraburkholderia sp. PGU16]